MLLNLGGTWYKIQANKDLQGFGFVSHVHGLVLMCEPLYKELEKAKNTGNVEVMKKVFAKLEQAEQLTIK